MATGISSGIAAIHATYQGHSASVLVTTALGDIAWSGPIIITQGGTYSGNWRSTDPHTAAVTVATTEPVLIENSFVTGPSDLINDPYWGNNLTVKNVVGVGTNPNISGQPYGMFVDAQNPALLDVENCYFENVHYGIWVRGYAGNRDGTQTITILNNRSRNLLGLVSDGNGGFLPGNQYWAWSHAIQLSNVFLVPGIRIGWNELINYPYRSLVNEVINLYDAGGTDASPAQIHDNFIEGAYPYDPAVNSYNGGGITTDGSSSDTVASAPSFNHVYNNQVIGTVNMGIEFGAGHDNLAWNNTVISSGLLPNGAKIPAQNVGLTIYDVYGNRARGTMYNNDMHGNTVGWMCWAARCAWDGYRNDEYFPDDSGDYGTNSSVAANPIPLAAETKQYSLWLSRTAANGIVVGPRDTSVTPPPPSNTGASLSPGAWYTVVNSHSGLCVETLAWGYANGTPIQQNHCGTAQENQEWQFQPTDSGFYQVVNRYGLTRTRDHFVWNVGNQSLIELAGFVGAANEQWKPVPLGGGTYQFVSRGSGECLDIPRASSASLILVQQYICNGTVAQAFALVQK
jgi:hypothetical protein